MTEKKSSKRPKFPLLLTGNDLLSGEVVYFSRKGWTTALAEALVATDDSTAETLERALGAALDRIVEPELVTFRVDAAERPLPATLREEIRASGPTIAYGAAA